MRMQRLVWAGLVLLGCAESSPSGPSGPPIYAVYVSPGSYAFIVGETVQLRASATRMDCDLVFCKEQGTYATFTWRSSNPGIVTVSEGLVRAVGRGSAWVKAVAGGVADSAFIRVGSAYVPLDRMGRGGRCALTASGVPYCWGFLLFNSPEGGGGWNEPRRVAGLLQLASVQVGTREACGRTVGGQGYCWGQTAQQDSSGDPALVPGGLTFESLSPGEYHTCGVATGAAAYCWGVNGSGQLGNGGSTDHPTPLPVSGGLAFTTISAGRSHTCGVTAAGAAYCWGDNTSGQLGDGTTTSRTVPTLVQGATALTSIIAAMAHTCGLDAGGAAWCWGENRGGQLGIGSIDTIPHPVPEQVAGGLAFVALDAAAGSCALTSAGQAYCWGHGVSSPAAVPGGLTFRSIGVGGWWTSDWLFEYYSEEACGIGTDSRGYCWNRWTSPSLLVGPIEP